VDTNPSRLLGAVQLLVRSEPRYAARLEAELQRDDAPQLTISVGNVSPSGFMALTPEPLRAGTPVRLVLPVGDPVDAQVVWSLNDRIGCRLDGRFSRHQMAYLLMRSAIRGIPTAAGARAALVIFLIGFLIFNN
jgi:hypothetical protein